MKLHIHDLDNKKQKDEVNLDKDIFGVEANDGILHRVVRWQLAKKRSGTHKTKTISEISGTGKKPYKQKGTGNARQGSLRSAQFRGGSTIFGPQPRDYSYALPKKVRKLGLKLALSQKAKDGNIVVLNNADLKEHKTKDFAAKISKFECKNCLIIDNERVNENLAKASKNLHIVNVLPQIGTNVYDVISHEKILITQSALETLVKRLK